MINLSMFFLPIVLWAPIHQDYFPAKVFHVTVLNYVTQLPMAVLGAEHIKAFWTFIISNLCTTNSLKQVIWAKVSRHC